jgi:hypothetical protein
VAAVLGPRRLETKRPKEPEPGGPEKRDLRGLKSHPTKKKQSTVQLKKRLSVQHYMFQVYST